MRRTSERRHPRRAFYAAVMLCLLSLAVFVVAWRHGNQLILLSENFETVVPHYKDAGRLEDAYEIAALAHERHPEDIDAHLWFLRMRNATRYESGFDAIFDQGLADDCPYPITSPQNPYYNAAARFENAALDYAHNEPQAALSNLLLAAAFSRPLPDDRPGIIAGIYAANGDWRHALQYEKPEEAHWRAKPVDELLAIARAAGYCGEWSLCRDVADAARTQSDSAEACYWLGRALEGLNQRPQAIEILEKAVQLGAPDAPFFLGQLCEATADQARALAAYERTSEESVYWLFSAARALALTGDHSETTLVGQISRLLERLGEAAPPISTESGRATTWTLIGARAYPHLAHLSGVTPVLSLWDNHDAPSSSPLMVTRENRDDVALEYGTQRLELRWLDNLVPAGGFEHWPAQAGTPPGWPTPYEDGADCSYAVVEEDGLGALQVCSVSEDTENTIASVPMAVETARMYLLAVQCRSDNAHLVAGWRWFDKQGRELEDYPVANQEIINGWQWRAVHRFAPAKAAYVQATLGIHRDQGKAFFRHIAIVPLDTPTH